MTLALVRDMRELRAPSSADEVADFETDVLAGFVLARASAGLVRPCYDAGGPSGAVAD